MHDGVHLPDDRPGLLELVAVNLDVHRLLRTEARDPLDDAAWVKKHGDAWEELQDLGAHVVHDLDLITRPPVRWLEIDLDQGGVWTSVGVEQRGAALAQHTGAGNDRVEFFRANVFAQHALDLRHLLLGFFDPLTHRRPDDDPELTLVRDRNELGPDEGQQAE